MSIGPNEVPSTSGKSTNPIAAIKVLKPLMSHGLPHSALSSEQIVALKSLLKSHIRLGKRLRTLRSSHRTLSR